MPNSSTTHFKILFLKESLRFLYCYLDYNLIKIHLFKYLEDNTMDDQIKIFISELLNEGISLSDIQKRLASEHNYKTTFLELRLLAAELEDIDWTKQKADVEAAEAAKKAEEEKSKEKDAEPVDSDGKTVVEVSKLKRPGALANGTVKFASGITADWVLDQMGRLGLENNSGEPNEQDIQEFQMELQNVLSKSGY